ncbi:hypothetical protein [Flavobacterium sp.]|jgi:hypothetical protein|uniref:hypothetical protein n=1 Tax=Flavobacterium sp. TaxID=239 RepID=UPI00391C0D77
MKIYESEGTFSPTKKEFSFKVQATKIGEDTYEIKQYFDICRNDRFAIVAILSTKNGNKNDLSRKKPNHTIDVTNIPYSKLKRDLRKPDDSDIADAVNKKNEIILYVHHAIGFDINNPEDKAYLESYKNGTATNPPSIAGGAPPGKKGTGVLL